jgi:hypothetical protein
MLSPELTDLIWKTALMLFVAAPAAGARVLLAWAVDATTRPPARVAFVLFVASMLAAVTAVNTLTAIPKLAGMEQVIAGLAGFLAQDAFVIYATAKTEWQKDPAKALRNLRGWAGAWLAGKTDSSPKNKPNDPNAP